MQGPFPDHAAYGGLESVQIGGFVNVLANPQGKNTIEVHIVPICAKNDDGLGLCVEPLEQNMARDFWDIQVQNDEVGLKIALGKQAERLFTVVRDRQCNRYRAVFQRLVYQERISGIVFHQKNSNRFH